MKNFGIKLLYFCISFIIVLILPFIFLIRLIEKIIKKDILVFVQSNQSDILKRLKKRKNFNQKLLKKFKAIQYPASYKKKKSNFVIKNNFTKKSINDGINNILKKII